MDDHRSPRPRRPGPSRATLALVLACIPIAAAAACSASNGGSEGFTDANSTATGTGGESSTATGTGGVNISGSGGLDLGGSGPGPCPMGKKTSVSGTVIAPTPAQYGQPDPIYNAVVYSPTAPIDPFPAGVACDKCGTPTSGKPAAATLSDSHGKFVLSDLPSGKNVPLVIQVGRWRRQVTIPSVTACMDNPLPPDLTRLPRNKMEGDIPHIAIATSTYDAEECILRKIGIDDAEFTASSGNGRIHLYEGNGSTIPGALPMDALWTDINVLKQYDMVQFPCSSVPYQNTQVAFQNIVDYANLGGRVFATDLSYPWFEQAPAPFPSTAQWTTWGGIGVDPLQTLIDQTFPKGKALAEWLNYIGATPMLGEIDLFQTYHVVNGVNPPSTRWLYSLNPPTVQTYSFNTPVGVMPDQQCGRAVYSNFHIATESPAPDWPQECTAGPLTPQEKVMEFLLFDLSSCVQNDQDPPDMPK